MPPEVGKAGDVSAPVVPQAPVKIEEPKTKEIDTKDQKQELPKQDAETAAKNAEGARQHANDIKNQDTARVQIMKNELEEKLPDKKTPPGNVEKNQATPSKSNETLKDQLAESMAKGPDGPKVLVDTAPVQAGPMGPTLDENPLVNRSQGAHGDAQQIGRNLAQTTKANPANAAQMVDQTLRNFSPSTQGDVASEIAKSYTDQELQGLAQKKEGREFLDVVENGMLDGNVENAHQVQINRIRDARLSSPGSPEDQANLVLRKGMQPGPLDDKFVGKEIAKEIQKDPSKGTRMADWVLRHALRSDRMTITNRIAENLDKQQLKDLAKNRDGRNLLNQMQKELAVPNTKLPQMVRIEEALNESAPIFEARRELERTPNFKDLSKTTRKEMLNVVEQNVGDKEFGDALKRLVGNPEFQKLGDGGAKVINDLNKFAHTGSYLNMKKHSDKALDIIANMSVYTEGGHANNLPTARNTLDQFVNDKVKMKLVDKGDTTIAGKAETASVLFNVRHPQLLDNPENLMTTAAHEVNHVINGQSQPGMEHFLDEYRAYYMEQTAIGKKNPDPEHINDKLQEITMDEEPYKDINRLYNNDFKFRNVVEEMYKGLEATPTRIMSPETLRAKLRALPGGNTDYMKKTPNMDNH